MKSAIELAMERSGGGDKKLSDGQKNEIAELRSKEKAKKAQEEIMFKEKTAALPAGPEREEIEGRYARDIAKIEAETEAEIEKIRKG
jgi:hypothetical protein